jgi:hypothetical protein
LAISICDIQNPPQGPGRDGQTLRARNGVVPHTTPPKRKNRKKIILAVSGTLVKRALYIGICETDNFLSSAHATTAGKPPALTRARMKSERKVTHFKYSIPYRLRNVKHFIAFVCHGRLKDEKATDKKDL